LKVASVFYEGNIGDKYCNNLFWKDHFKNVKIVKTNYTPKSKDEIIIFGGGGYFLGSNMKNLLSEFQKLNQMNIRYGVVGVGDQNLPDIWYHYMAKILKGAELVTVRDKYAKINLEKHGLKDVKFIPDLMWNINPKKTKVKLDASCCYIPRPEKMWHENNLDIPKICNKFDFVHRAKDPDTLWNAHDYNLYELPNILSQFDKIICSKYHAAIMCLISNVKLSIVTYGFNKMFDIATEFDLPIWNSNRNFKRGDRDTIKWYKDNAYLNIKLVEEVFGCKRI
jgi:hypothetical protein